MQAFIIKKFLKLKFLNEHQDQDSTPSQQARR
jgi:hypothetical protein